MAKKTKREKKTKHLFLKNVGTNTDGSIKKEAGKYYFLSSKQKTIYKQNKII